MLIALYRIPIKTNRWYVRLFWHLIDMCKVNAWLLYRRHHEQLGNLERSVTLVQFILELTEGLIHANKPVPIPAARGRPRRSTTPSIEKRGREPTVALPFQDKRYDEIGHWPEHVDKKNGCRYCIMTCRSKCEKCNIYLCFVPDRNCFKEFHTK